MARARDEGRVAEAARLYHEENLTARAVGARIGVHERTVRRWLGDGTRPPGPQPSSSFPAALWQAAIRAGGSTKNATEITVVCPEHEPGGRTLAEHASQKAGREAAGRHYQASGHSAPWVMDAQRWDALLEMARGT